MPKLPDIYCGIYLRERLDCEMLAALADAMSDALVGFRPGHMVAADGDVIDAPVEAVARAAPGR